MNCPKNYEFCFTPSCWIASFDEVLGEREFVVAFDFDELNDADMITEGIHMAVFAKHDGDEDWEEITHLLSNEEEADFLNECFNHLEQP